MIEFPTSTQTPHQFSDIVFTPDFIILLIVLIRMTKLYVNGRRATGTGSLGCEYKGAQRGLIQVEQSMAKNLPPRERRERESNKATRGKQILTATFKAVSLLRQKTAGKRSSHSVCNHNNNPPPQRRHESYLCIELYKSLQESDLHR